MAKGVASAWWKSPAGMPAWGLAIMLSGCASPPDVAPPVASPAPLFCLSPASLGQPLALQQRLTVTFQGQVQPPVDVLLEVDPRTLQAALMVAGSTMARLNWDGESLVATQSPGWPQRLPAAQVLSDLQLAWWPVPVLRAALPAGWLLEAEGGLRSLRQGGKTVVTVHGAASPRIELDHWQLGYHLLIESVGLEPVAVGEGAR
jgi:Protein of unknown function (DUF3261)